MHHTSSPSDSPTLTQFPTEPEQPMSARAVQRVARSAIRNSRFLQESLCVRCVLITRSAQPRPQRVCINVLKMKGVRPCAGFGNEASLRSFMNINRMAFMTKVEVRACRMH